MDEDGFEGEYLYDPFGEDDGDWFQEGFDLPDMDDFDPYDDPPGYLIDDLGDDDGDYDDEDWADDFEDEADLLDDAPPEGAHLVEDEMWETPDDEGFDYDDDFEEG